MPLTGPIRTLTNRSPHFRHGWAFLLALCALGGGCRTTGPSPTTATNRPATPTDAPVENLFSPEALPATIRRVVLLPVFYPAYQEEIHDYVDNLWAQAIQRQNRFEVVALDRETVSDWSGRTQWSSTEAIPSALRERIQSTYEPDAILLCDLTRLESYQPLEIGLRCKLFQWSDGEFLWGVDGVWTRDPEGNIEAKPSRLAAIFKNSQKDRENALHLATISPRYFYYHLVESVALTLPTRQSP